MRIQSNLGPTIAMAFDEALENSGQSTDMPKLPVNGRRDGWNSAK